MVMFCSTVGAALKLALPSCDARIVTTPAPWILTFPSEVTVAYEPPKQRETYW